MKEHKKENKQWPKLYRSFLNFNASKDISDMSSKVFMSNFQSSGGFPDCMTTGIEIGPRGVLTKKGLANISPPSLAKQKAGVGGGSRVKRQSEGEPCVRVSKSARSL